MVPRLHAVDHQPKQFLVAQPGLDVHFATTARTDRRDGVYGDLDQEKERRPEKSFEF
jgi:hypothetical protein